MTSLARSLRAGQKPISEDGMRVLEARYLRRDTDGKIVETPAQLFERVARAIAEAGQSLRLAFELGCKDITVFRYGSKSETVLELGLEETPEQREHFTKCGPDACRR